uniref:Uncharacterized protein G9-1 n=1 Tax=Musa acuminata TaxID=4641 RepID=Q6RZW4_MUSAC|nr:hypothetical protein [Musa acuminata]
MAEVEGEIVNGERRRRNRLRWTQREKALARVGSRRCMQVLGVAQACCAVLQSWVSKKFMTGVVLFPVAITFYVTWWFIQFVDGFFSPLYDKLGVDIFESGSKSNSKSDC